MLALSLRLLVDDALVSGFNPRAHRRQVVNHLILEDVLEVFGVLILNVASSFSDVLLETP